MDNFNIHNWKFNQLIKEGISDINPNTSFEIWDFLIKKLTPIAKKQGLRMSIFEEVFPTASSFYNALDKGSINEDDSSKESYDVTYTEQGDFYKSNDSKGRDISFIKFNQILSDMGLENLPRKYNEEILNNIKNQLSSRGIDFNYNDWMDIG